MIIAVLDTNVLASGFVGEDKPESTPGELIRRWRSGSFILVTSEHILTELAGTFTDPYFIQRLPAVTNADALDSLRIDAFVQPVTEIVSGVASHAEDDVVLATALSAGAEYLVTGDKELRQLGACGGTQLLLPRRVEPAGHRVTFGRLYLAPNTPPAGNSPARCGRRY